MYSIIRLIIGCVFLVCSIIAIKKSKAIRKRILYAVFTGISVGLSVLLMFLPFENLFLTFNSPEAAYEYYSFRQSNIEIVEGNDCDFIIDRRNDGEEYLIIPKTEDGWKIGIGSDTGIAVQKFSEGISIYVYQYQSTCDYFITILDTNGGESTVVDEYNTEFVSFERNNDSLGKKFVTYYAHIRNLDSEYSVTVNGNEIVLENQ